VAKESTKGARIAKRCAIKAVGIRRDGRTRYWCMLHKADATAKYGKRANSCRYSKYTPLGSRQTFTLDLDLNAEVALWGAVPPVYDTTKMKPDRGIHVHIRKQSGDKKLDKTYRTVRLIARKLPARGILIEDLDAIYFMVSSIFNFRMRHIICPFCKYSHLDRDWFSIHPHGRHLCAGCGKYFRDSGISVGNPIIQIHDLLGVRPRRTVMASHTLTISQKDYPGGIQIWGSNPAFLWTASRFEQEGIHIHAFDKNGRECINETFSEVEIDGVHLNPGQVRVLMAQKALPHIRDRVTSLICPFCDKLHFSIGSAAITPTDHHLCSICGHKFRSKGRLRKLIGNPIVAELKQLAAYAPRSPRNHVLDLIPETLSNSPL
jgi:hypothetical protein